MKIGWEMRSDDRGTSADAAAARRVERRPLTRRPRTQATAVLVFATLGTSPVLADQPFDDEAVTALLTRATRQAQENCTKVRNAEGKLAGPWGTATVTIVLGHASGRVRELTLDETFDDTPPGRCIEGAYKLLMVPPWTGRDKTVERAIVLEKPPEAEAEERAAQKKANAKGKKK